MYDENAFAIMADAPVIFLAASTLGLGVNYLTYVVIQTTNSLTVNVLGTVRNIGIIFIGMISYGEIITMKQVIDKFLIVVNVILFS